MKGNFIEVATYEHFDGFYILKREDTGQEVSLQDFEKLEIISLEKNNLLFPPMSTNAVLFLEEKIENNQSLREAYYISLKNMLDDGIRSFCNGKIFGKKDWINEMKLNYDRVYSLKGISF